MVERSLAGEGRPIEGVLHPSRILGSRRHYQQQLLPSKQPRNIKWYKKQEQKISGSTQTKKCPLPYLFIRTRLFLGHFFPESYVVCSLLLALHAIRVFLSLVRLKEGPGKSTDAVQEERDRRSLERKQA